MLNSDRVVRSTCPYCGVGCQVSLHVKDDYIYRVGAPFDAAPNYGMLCVKGRFGIDSVMHPTRLKTPLIRANTDQSFDNVYDYVAWLKANYAGTEHYNDVVAAIKELYPELKTMQF